ncbi:MAG: hypothetical protein ABIQ53_15215, partial [Terracoccus sp.]
MPKQQFADVLGRGVAARPLTPAARLALLTAEVRVAWANPFARRGTLGMALVAAGSLTPAF